LKALADPKVRAKMAHFGVNVPNAHGISAPVLHRFAKRIGKNHALAQALWATGIHEARILATLIGESVKVSSEMDLGAFCGSRWMRCCLYARTKFA
jgi:3-methyladenine DNA glycosylase AlkD